METASRRGFWLTLSVLATLLAVTLAAQLPGRLAPPWLRQQSGSYAALWPQGWAFFASHPTSPTISVYRVAASGALTATLVQQTSVRDQWGLSQTSTAEYMEAAYITQEVSESQWTSCSISSVQRCLSRERVIQLTDPFEPGLICGPVLFVVDQSRGTTHVPAVSGTRALAARIDLSCS